ncbi:pyridoxal phosphate-dependent aminotransferase [Nakamurella multipartita]|uniref:Aminotransferase class I and II n=1 Tax=Nakamurella multipartita (strain ATCC 700099 / DSM 44233 / CIP 104796 / JCM 9543 / NBRC 105858 / Y-104) TaxID=479431 RepID=C8XA81_NAKMY|nr:pyridoxal phosphate-dependent aminotransferase [Nakamurella multipartita]ACV77246.1 aminotransferase class I and II [Nakamurella multipartita DSM 44233]
MTLASPRRGSSRWTDPLVSRLRPYTTTIFAEMSALASRTGSINLGQGFPDTDGPPSVLAAARQAIADGINQYPPGPGIPELRQAIAFARERDYGQVFDPDTEVLVTVGATEALAASVLGLIEPGAEVLLIEPHYDSYPPIVAMAGGRHRSVPLRPDAGGRFALDVDEVAAAIGPATRMLIVNSPHNPTGTVLDATELAGLARLAVEHDLVVVTDEVYEYLTFDGVPHLPLATFEGMAERTLTISSSGKSFSTTGWKIGWVCGPAPLVAAVRAAKQFLTYVGGAPFQPAVAHALRHEMPWVADLRGSLQGKRDRLCAGLAAAGFGVGRPQGTYFVMTDIRPLGATDGMQFCLDLPARAGVVAIPDEVFHDDPADGTPFVRFAFCKRDEVIDEAVQRLAGMP